MDKDSIFWTKRWTDDVASRRHLRSTSRHHLVVPRHNLSTVVGHSLLQARLPGRLSILNTYIGGSTLCQGTLARWIQ